MVDQYKDVIQESTILTSMKFGGFAEEAAGAHTVAGIRPRDKLIAVLRLFGRAAAFTEALAVANLTSEFTITADNTISNVAGTSFVDSYGLVIWLAIPPELG